MYPPEISVGVVSIALHITALLTMTITCMVGARCLRHLANLRVKKYGRAPVVFHAYATSFGSILGMIRVMRITTPGLSLVLILVFLLLPAEAALNLAVDTYDMCQPRKLLTKGVCADTRKTRHRIEIGIFYSLQSMPWDDGMLERRGIHEGFRRDIQGNEYFGPNLQRNTSLPLVIAGCTVSEHNLIPPNNTTVLLGSNHGYKSYAALAGLSSGNKSIAVSGFMDSSRILAVSGAQQWLETGINLTVFEYYDEKHIKQLRTNIDRRRRWTRLPLLPPLVTYNVSCASTGLSAADGIEAIVWYRFTQLHSSKLANFRIVTKNKYNLTAKMPMTPSCLVRAMLAMKYLENEMCPGETMIWTECGIVRPHLAIPVFGISFMMFVLWFALEVKAHRTPLTVNVPVTASEWYNFAMKGRYRDSEIDVDEDDAEYKQLRNDKCDVFIREDADCYKMSDNSIGDKADSEDLSKYEVLMKLENKLSQ